MTLLNRSQKKSKQFFQAKWKILILIISISMSILLIISFIILGKFFIRYGADYIAYWSAGKIADEIEYAEIYNLRILRDVQGGELEKLGIISTDDIASIRILPANYFSFFIIPFQFLSRIDLYKGYWVWSIINTFALVGYLTFFVRKMPWEDANARFSMKFLFLIMVSYTVLSNFILGQINVFLMICTGEFIRNVINKKPIISGIWLGGLLIKPQSLILVIPAVLFLRNWKILTGFILSSCSILIISFILSGLTGTGELIDLWRSSSIGDDTSNAEAFINWRMIGLNLNHVLNNGCGWIITGAGMILTLTALYFLLNRKQSHGSPSWVITMLGVFSANLAFTWHSHQHMAMVLIPFLIYGSVHKLLSDNVIILWATVTQVVWFGLIVLGADANLSTMVVATSGFIMNLLIFAAVLTTSLKGEKILTKPVAQ